MYDLTEPVDKLEVLPEEEEKNLEDWEPSFKDQLNIGTVQNQMPTWKIIKM